MNTFIGLRGLKEGTLLKHTCSLSQLDLDTTKLKKSLAEKPMLDITAQISLSSLCHLIQKRMFVDKTLTAVPSDVQRIFEDIILEKVRSVFGTIQQNIPDPALNFLDNNELWLRVILYIITVCEQLFLHYVYMMESHKDHPLFSNDVNFTRIKTQLLMDCCKFLNIIQVKRLLVEDLNQRRIRGIHGIHASGVPVLKRKSIQGPSWRTESDGDKGSVLETFDSVYTMEQFIKSTNIIVCKKQEIKEILSDVEKSYLEAYQIDDLLPDLLKADVTFRRMPREAIRSPYPPQHLDDSVILQKADSEEGTISMKRSHSMPNLDLGDILEEVSEVTSPHAESSAIVLDWTTYENIEELIADDLKWLMQDFSMKHLQREVQNDETDIPPLIKVLTYNKKHAAKLEKLEQAIKDLDEKEKNENLKEGLKLEMLLHPHSYEWDRKITDQPFMTTSKDRKPFTTSTFQKYSSVSHDYLEEILDQQDKLKLEKQAHFEAATRDFKMPNKPLLKTADVQFSDRLLIDSPEFNIHLPMYSDLAGEMTSSDIQELDKRLFIGSKFTKIYREFTENLPRQHLIFDQDPSLESIAFGVKLSHCMSSSILARKSQERAINAELRDVGRNIWSSSLNNLLVQEHVSTRQMQQNQLSSWPLWWMNKMSLDDYLKYMSKQDTDYLSVIFHLYDSDDEEEEQRILAITSPREMKRELDKIITEDETETETETETVEGKFSAGLRNGSSLTSQTHGTVSEGYKLGEGLPSHLQIPMKAMKADDDYQIQEDMSEDELLQKKLEAIWLNLYIPYHSRLDMAIKYCSSKYQGQLRKIITDWEMAAYYIQKREELLRNLEIFERTASDPNRFFQRGYKATFLERVREAKKRKYLHSLISEIEKVLLKILQMIQKKFNDTVTYKGRPYLEKMKWDKIEMLYWLQQERREILMEPVIHKERAGLKLPPMNTPQL
uniref:Coiled-coil domain-containing protein 87 isoform X2 n=1 Tax=Geotrypetes seraphini TaxID=260995 RepID=A0A6P8RP52_GEOSA|nr:coiled-coil domain-containing protein 87 isoform X2 [Geotrypetes seraphini]